jgi:hypothetical protein
MRLVRDVVLSADEDKTSTSLHSNCFVLVGAQYNITNQPHGW